MTTNEAQRPDPADELAHPVGDDPAWSESYYFNFVDPTTGVGMFTRMGLRAGDGWADGLHAVYLGGRRVAFCYGRRDLPAGDHELEVGGLRLEMQEPFGRWVVHYDGPAQDIGNGDILITPRKERPEGWYSPATLKMSVTFDALAGPHYAARGQTGHFEQTGHVTGTISVGDDTWDVDGYGVRDKSWGPRSWSASGSPGDGTAAEVDDTDHGNPPTLFTTWFSGNFGPDLAFGGSCFRFGGQIRGKGWLSRKGEVVDLNHMTVTSTFGDDPLLHTGCRITGTTADGEDVVIDGEVLSMCPTKIPQPGGATLVNEGLARFRCGELEGYGIAEYWHAVRRDG